MKNKVIFILKIVLLVLIVVWVTLVVIDYFNALKIFGKKPRET